MDSKSQNEISEADWNQLSELRQIFLSEDNSIQKDYWHSQKLLELYHLTFAQRIGWKWDAVLSELQQKEVLKKEKKYVLFDFGCGTGIAAHKVLVNLGGEIFSEVWLWDSSVSAIQFACKKLTTSHQGLNVRPLTELTCPESSYILCLSHVINEMNKTELGALIPILEKAELVIWIEPGTKDNSRRLIKVRESLRDKVKFIAPCNHCNSCGMIQEANQNHWCHFFALPPAEVFQSAFWKKFSQVLKVDLRALPVSYLIFGKNNELVKNNGNVSRVIGRPRIYKGSGKFLLCNEDGVRELSLLEKKHKQLFREYKRDIFSKNLAKEDLK